MSKIRDVCEIVDSEKKQLYMAVGRLQKQFQGMW